MRLHLTSVGPRLDALYAGYENMYARVNFVYDLTQKLDASCTSFLTRLDTIEIALLTADENAVGMVAGACGGAGGSQWMHSRGRSSGCSHPIPAPTPTGPGLPGSSADRDRLGMHLRAFTGGNDMCHCVHVTELIEKVATLEARDPRGHDHLLETGWRQRPQPDSRGLGPDRSDTDDTQGNSQAP